MAIRHRLLRPVALLAVAGLVIAACGDDDSSDGGDSESATDTGSNGDSNGGGGDGELAGESVEIFGAYSGDEADLMRETLTPLIDATGIDVEFVDSPAFDTEITTRVEGGNVPDIAFFPQPGLLLDIADQTSATPVSDYLDIDALEASLIPGFLDAATAEDGIVYGFPVRMAVKSALWRTLPGFDDAGYAVPTDDAELAALEDQIIADGSTPWCLGMESGPATGWVGTDWVEEYMLRLHGPDVYDQWVSGELPFDSPEVREAFAKFEELWNKDDNVVGGDAGVLGLSFGDSTGRPLHRSAELLPPPAGQLHHRVLPRGRPGRPRHQRRRLVLPARGGRL